MMSWSSLKKKECIFRNVYFVRRKVFKHLCFISMYSVLNKFSVYIYIYILVHIKKALRHTILLLVFKIVESFQCILNFTFTLEFYIFRRFSFCSYSNNLHPNFQKTQIRRLKFLRFQIYTFTIAIPYGSSHLVI